MASGRDYARGITALVVDDDVLIAWAVESVLDDLGVARVVVAASGESAIEAARTNDFGLIIVDLNLGPLSINGLELLEAIDHDERVPTIVHTSYDNIEVNGELERSRPRAARMIKPVTDRDMAAAIVTALTGRVTGHNRGASPDPNAIHA